MSQTQECRPPRGVIIRGPLLDRFAEVLSTPALEFIAQLHRQFEERRQGLLRLRERRQQEFDAGARPRFLEHTRRIRESEWKAAYTPDDLLDRRVEITGPVDRKMIINALNSGAKVYMADFEDSSAPTWHNMIDGQINLRDAVAGTISIRTGDNKVYKLRPRSELATLMVRPRGWHLDEAHVLVDGQPMSGSLFDFGLFFFHNAQALIDLKTGPYFYLPKMESHLEARLWNDVFVFAQNYCHIPRGTVRATVLIETIPAAFEMDEIIFELREHSAGMNCGRWDYIFSMIKKVRTDPSLVLPDRVQVGMDRPFLANYVKLLIKTCHRRGVHAMGGMAAQIPVKNDAQANRAAIDKVRADKLREVLAGHDGTWVAHPALIPVAMEIFNQHMKGANQLEKIPEAKVSEADLFDLGSPGTITEQGLRGNVNVGLAYLEAWLNGNGCVPLHNLMEDAATAEISRTQIWQWIRHGAHMKGPSNQSIKITKDVVAQYLKEELESVKKELGAEAYNKRKFEVAARIYGKLMLSDQLSDFLTLEAYPLITTFVDSPGTSAL